MDALSLSGATNFAGWLVTVVVAENRVERRVIREAYVQQWMDE